MQRNGGRAGCCRNRCAAPPNPPYSHYSLQLALPRIQCELRRMRMPASALCPLCVRFVSARIRYTVRRMPGDDHRAATDDAGGAGSSSDPRQILLRGSGRPPCPGPPGRAAAPPAAARASAPAASTGRRAAPAAAVGGARGRWRRQRVKGDGPMSALCPPSVRSVSALCLGVLDGGEAFREELKISSRRRREFKGIVRHCLPVSQGCQEAKQKEEGVAAAKTGGYNGAGGMSG